METLLKVTVFAKHVNGSVRVLEADSFEKIGFSVAEIVSNIKDFTMVKAAIRVRNADGTVQSHDISSEIARTGEIQTLKATVAG